MPKLNPNFPLQRGILALSRRDYPSAFKAFRRLYQSPHWQQRDLAVTALSDLFDTRIIEDDKPPNCSLVSGWQVPPTSNPMLSKPRLLVLLETFIHPTLCRPRNLLEHRTVQALQTTQNFLEHVLLHDPEYLVRFSTLVALNEYFPDERRYVILPTFQQALKHERNPDLKVLLEHFLATTVQ